MTRLSVRLFPVFAVLLASISCQSAEQQNERSAAVAGSFYPADATKLTATVDEEISHANVPRIDGTVMALIAPHAGYQFSGSVAAHSYAMLRGKKFKRVILIGPSHVEGFGYTSIYGGQSYATPLGKVMVDLEFARKLAPMDRSMRISSTGHAVREQLEHSLEVQLPFLQRVLGDFKIVPIVIGNQSYESSRELGMALAKLLRNDSETLLVASSDLSHFHAYDEAVRMDRGLLNAITQNDFLTVSQNLDSRVWEACGGGPIVAVMLAAQQLGAGPARLIKYANSGDVTGEKSRVVGYSALAFIKGGNESKPEHLTISDAERSELLKIARLSVESAVRDHKTYEPPTPGTDNLRQERGVFVTLTRKGQLRGCIGYTSPVHPLYLAVREVAALAALRDPRFAPVRPDELGEIDYEISVLSPFLRVLDAKAIRVGDHGLLIRRGNQVGVLLPQVPVEQDWDRTTFLEEASLKAGLPRNSWQDEHTDVFTFTATVFSDHENSSKKPGAKHP
jgi:AmmeMemoRadiSam system protein B/AmmeMemoRadiSam system protein A